MNERERRRAFRIRRIALFATVTLLVVATLTFCSVHALDIRGKTNGAGVASSSAQSRNSTADGDAKTRKSRGQRSSNGTSANARKAAKGESGQKQDTEQKTGRNTAVEEALDAQSASLSDEEKAKILSNAEQVAQNSGHDVVRYRYCVTTKGNVGDAEEFANAAYRILNDAKGWPRAGAVFEQSTDQNTCDFNLVLSEAQYMKSFSSGCSEEYSCRVGQDVIINDNRWTSGTESWLSAGGDLARYRVMVINHEVGHRLGHKDNETTCAGAGQAAPLMQEQSMHLDGCSVNEYPLDSELWIQ